MKIALTKQDLGAEIRGVIHHEFTHVYQHNDGPAWLIEGISASGRSATCSRVPLEPLARAMTMAP